VVRLLLLVVGLVIFGVVLRVMGVAEILALARRSGWTLAWMTGLYALHLTVRGWVIWRSLPIPRIPLTETVRIRFAAEAVETLTFTGPFLAEPAKGFMFIRRGVAPARAAGVIVFEQLTYMLVAAAMALTSLIVLLRRGAFSGGVHGAIVGLVAALGVFAAGVLWASITGIGLLAPAARLLSPVLGPARAAAVVDSIAEMELHLLDMLHGNKPHLIEALAAQTFGNVLLALEVILLFRALGFHGHRIDPVIVEGGVKFVNSAFIFIPGQFGAAEGANALIVGALGYPAVLGVTLSLMRRVRTYLVAAVGLLAAPPR
jgi:hypothetical protein